MLVAVFDGMYLGSLAIWIFEYLLSGWEKEAIATEPLWNLLNPSVFKASGTSLSSGKLISDPVEFSVKGKDELVWSCKSPLLSNLRSKAVNFWLKLLAISGLFSTLALNLSGW